MNKEKLHELNKEILNKELEILSDEVKSNEQELRLDLESLSLMKQISEEINADGKPLFSNETKRKAEFLNRTQTGSIFDKLKKEIEEHKTNIKRDKILVSYMKRQVKIECEKVE